MHKPADPYDEIREAIAKLCARFPGSYWRALDREMTYPTEFVAAFAVWRHWRSCISAMLVWLDSERRHCTRLFGSE